MPALLLPMLLRLLPYLVIAGLVWAVWSKVHTVAALETELATQRDSLGAMQDAQASQLESYGECLAVNAANSRRVAEAKSKAVEAEMRLAASRAVAVNNLARLREDEKTMREAADPVCRRMGDPLPDDFVGRLLE